MVKSAARARGIVASRNHHAPLGEVANLRAGSRAQTFGVALDVAILNIVAPGNLSGPVEHGPNFHGPGEVGNFPPESVE